MPQLEAKVQSSDKLVLRKIDIVRWGTPVAAQYNIRSIPYLILYGPDGQEVARGTAKVLKILEKL